MSKVNRFAEIRKVEDNDDGSVTIYGVASTEAVDAHGEVVSKSAMENALPDFFKYGTGALRSMHQPIAAGVVNKATINAAGETEIEATVVDPVEVAKVKAGVYKGLSIGGSKLPGGYDSVTKTITAMKLTEISLVDRPANPEATITMWKLEDEPAAVATVAPEQVAAVDALADILNKGDVSPERLVELAQAEVLAKAAAAAKDGADDEELDADGKPKGKKAPPFGDKAEKADGVLPAEPDSAVAIVKSMYSVSRFAEVIQSIGCLVSDAEWEADCERDDSPVPAKLRAWLTAGAALFQELAIEEINEFIEAFQTPEATSAAIVELSDQATTLRKSLDDAVGSGLAGYLSIAKAHMPEDDVARLVLTDGFEKATAAVLARLTPDSEAIAKLADATDRIGKLETERDALIAKVAALSAVPTAPKGVLRVVVEKSETAAPAADGPVLKADGTVDQDATVLQQIKKMHQSGGQPLRSFN